ASGLDFNYAYPVGAVDLTVGGEWLNYDETATNAILGDYDYFVLKSGVKFDF
ncbi:MAG: hypothetical protein H0Z38_08100, partial [Firmicutes bacterium]|nr:hypothetical protein [Bacillota bacterium]